MSTWSPELSFVPRKSPHIITNEEAAQSLIHNLNRQLFGMQDAGSMLTMMAKLDPQQSNPAVKEWVIEVTPILARYFETSWLDGGESERLVHDTLDYVFRLMRNNGLVPSVIKRRGSHEKHWPGGGCHIQYGMGELFDMSANWYKNMELFHRNLIMDYTNRPYIRWLFANWFADEHSHCVLNRVNLQSCEWTPDAIFHRGIIHAASLQARFMGGGKTTYLTFEWRMPSMPESAAEVILLAKFFDAWMNKVRDMTLIGTTITPTISVSNFKRWKGIRKLRDDTRHFLVDELHLDWQDYRVFFNRNSVRRVKFGSLI